MIGCETQIIKALLGGHNGIFSQEKFKMRATRLFLKLKVFLDFGIDDTERMVRLFMETTAYKIGDMSRYIVVGVIGSVTFGGGVVDLGVCGSRKPGGRSS
jgi:hypothetical protein